MAAFRIVPVVDLKNGRAVHAIKGQRDKYAPVCCSWCENGDVASLVRGYKEVFGLHDLYVADLDAIVLRKPNKAIYKEIIPSVDGEVMVDAGIASIDEFNDIASEGIKSLILGTETIPSISLLGDIIEQSEHAAIVSLDVKDGVVLSPAKHLSGTNIIDAFRIIERLEPSAIIFLDLSGVGARTGISPLAKKLVKKSRVPLYIGGGVSSASDIRDAHAAGFAGVLVATALQAGLISPDEVASLVV
ncbi:MAG: HisA/HisF-related TIM barrel protein [Candidatus Sigynarchaeota archaeon]